MPCWIDVQIFCPATDAHAADSDPENDPFTAASTEVHSRTNKPYISEILVLQGVHDVPNRT